MKELWLQDYRTGKARTTFSSQLLCNIRNCSTDINIELGKELYDTLDYLGIGIVVTGKDWDRWQTKYAFKVTAIANRIISAKRRFLLDIKKGATVEDARELMVEDLNSWITAQGRGYWRVFVRDDAPENY